MWVPSQRRARLYGLVGALLGLGAPAGWLALRLLSGQWAAGVQAELASQPGLYAYLTLGTMVAFAVFGAVVGAINDRLLSVNRRLEELVVTDGLTSLRNQRYFRERLASECARANRGEGPLSLMVVDIDHFKNFNDEFGHSQGDEVLVSAARHMATGCRISDVACRIGGEEFAIICPDTTLEKAVQVAERIRLGMAPTAHVTASFGVSAWHPGQSADDFFKEADAALYCAKEAGRNRVCAAPSGRPPGSAVASVAASG